MEKITVSWMVGNVVSKLVSPGHLATLWRRSRLPKAQRTGADAQLKLYSDLLPEGFIHLGYFDDPNTPPEKISLHEIAQAQRRHSEIVVEQVLDKSSPVLDVGCGTGGLARLLKEAGCQVVGLTPDRYQYETLQAKGELEVLHTRFEDIPLEGNLGRFGTVITSESLQYLDKHIALSVLKRLLKPNGRWILCDYLRLNPGHPWSFSWPELRAAVEGDFTIVVDRDITPHIVPTLKYVHMLGDRIARPATDFLIEKIKGKEPGVAYLLGDVFDRLQDNIAKNIHTTRPDTFSSEKQYRLMVLDSKA